MMTKRNCCIKSLAGLLLVLMISFGTAAWADSGGVTLEVGADTPVVKAGEGSRITVRVLVKPERRERETRAPLAVALVLDKSGSMASEEKMDYAKLGALEALKILDANDIAAVVVYDEKARVAVRARPVGKGNKEPVFALGIKRIKPSGMTALYDGVVLGAKQLEPFVKEGFIPRIVMLSDGVANVGPSTTRELAALGRKLARTEMTITTIGLGLDYHEDLMTALAAESGGNAYFARTSRMLKDIFARDMEDAVTLTARKVRVKVRGLGGARPERAVGRTGRAEDGVIEVSIDNLYSTEKYALVELELPGGEPGTTLEAAEVELEYVDPESGEKIVKKSPLTLAFTEDEDEVEKNRRQEIASQAALARNAEIREEAVRLADEGRAEEAAKMLGERTRQLRMLAPMMGSSAPAMEMESAAFDELADSLISEGGLSNVDRKTVLNEAYMLKSQQSAIVTTDSDEDEYEDEYDDED
ncbi:MAG: VWA domain-containing protein [Synergistaceae bacterium]|nr:VWA domain-containing protein [Synergistota bacterium]NLM71293.1 VWA domain-containing protein [Synergistaceae bacterium]